MTVFPERATLRNALVLPTCSGESRRGTVCEETQTRRLFLGPRLGLGPHCPAGSACQHLATRYSARGQSSEAEPRGSAFPGRSLGTRKEDYSMSPSRHPRYPGHVPKFVENYHVLASK